MRWPVVLILLIPAVAPTAAAQPGTPALFELTDPRGDPVLEVGGVPVQPPAAPPDNAVSSHIDILALRIVEDDPEWLSIDLEVAGRPSPANDGDFTTRYDFRVGFRLGQAPVAYQLHMVFGGPHSFGTLLPGPEYPGLSGLCIRPGSVEDTIAPCHWQQAPGVWFVDDGLVRWRVPKLSLVGAALLESGAGVPAARAPAPAGLPASVPPGTPMHAFEAEAIKTHESFTSLVTTSLLGVQAAVWRDRLPDDGPASEAHSLASPVGNHRLAFSVPEWPYPGATSLVLGVEPGVERALMLRLDNKNDAKRIVAVAAEPGAGRVVSGVETPPSVEVPAGDARFVRVALKVAADAPLGSFQNVTVSGTAAGVPGDLAFLRLKVVAVVPLAADAPTLYFHGFEGDPDPPEAINRHPVCVVRCPSLALWLNAQVEDPRANADDSGVPVGRFFPFLAQGVVAAPEVTTAGPLARNLLFDGNMTTNAEVAFASDHPFEATVTVRLFFQPLDCPPGACPQRVHVASGTAVGRIGSDGRPVAVALSLADGDVHVPAIGRQIGVVIEVRATDPGAAEMQAWSNLRLVPAGSRLVLPLIEAEATPVAGNVTLQAVGGTEEFVNPATARSFHLLAMNQGASEETVRLRIDAAPDTWTARIEPASSYRLPPGAAVNVTVLVRAPAGAGEGDQGVVRVEAIGSDGLVHDSARLTAIVTTGVGLADEWEAYTIDPEARERAVSSDAGSRAPGATLILVAAALAASVVARRRHTL